MENKKYFKKTTYSVTDPIKPKQKKVKVEWLFEDMSMEDIAKKEDGKYAIFPGCGCTANVEVLSDRIVAYYNDTTNPKDVLSNPNREKVVGKTVRVFFNDGKNLMRKNDRGVFVTNAVGKKNIILTFNVIVQA